MASTLMKIACVMVACMVMFAPHANAISCGQVSGGLSPCLTYLRNGGTPSAGCCNGVKSLSKSATTTADKKTACNCIKNLSGSIKGINGAYASSLPSKCGVSIPYKISPSTDCNKIQ